jgi:hypothetical protein
MRCRTSSSSARVRPSSSSWQSRCSQRASAGRQSLFARRRARLLRLLLRLADQLLQAQPKLGLRAGGQRCCSILSFVARLARIAAAGFGGQRHLWALRTRLGHVGHQRKGSDACREPASDGQGAASGRATVERASAGANETPWAVGATTRQASRKRGV